MRTSIQTLQQKKGNTPIVMITAYDAPLAALVDQAVDAILVGDSLGMVVQGQESTLPVTLDEMVYHTRLAGRGSKTAFLAADLPFMSYQVSVEQALRSAGRLVQEGGAQAVKLEGGVEYVPHVRALVRCGIPVVGHLGLTPQSIHVFGGYGKRAKEEAEAKKLREDARALEEAGLALLVLENIPHELAREVTALLQIPTIGIGAGPHCDGQVQVLHDLLGLFPEFRPRHAVRYLEGGKAIREAVETYAAEVRSGRMLSR
ncbi:MAG: 3-methyl-2-oxobutanoate hydroxymethyltransferase [Deltaproteobacteria bacterium]|nr:3-methyl-2-oxobutanoate hydroxymethyltransferase [Deltaproteobacteria bacterium]